jgi:hypothetical protein
VTRPEPEIEPSTRYVRVCCPECYEPVAVAPNAREGRCADCRPVRQHSHQFANSRDEINTRYAQFLRNHQRQIHHTQ